ncbi:hypothetical protein VTI74DRAFT_6733 [Chaetomium olivicolor]
MQFLTQVIISAGLAILTMGAAADGEPETRSIVEYCAYTGANLTGDHWLGLYCRNDLTAVFGYNYSWIDLDLCVGNSGGQLIPYDSGNYSQSCLNCDLSHEQKTLILTCHCDKIPSGRMTSSLDLNTAIYDDDGATGCFGHLGNKTLDNSHRL